MFDHVQTCDLIDRRYGCGLHLVARARGRRERRHRGDRDRPARDARRALSRGLRRRPRHRAPAARHRLCRRGAEGASLSRRPMVSTYLRARGLPDVARTRCWQYWIVNAGIRANIVAVDGDTEFLFSTRLERPDQKPDPAMIASAFRTAVGRDIPVEFIAHGTWTAGQFFVAERFGAGRVWMAGDAVHLFTPSGGFGMNTGIDDAANLGWKLAGMMQGWGGPRLLESYEVERRPVAFRNTGASKALTRSIGATPVAPGHQRADRSRRAGASRGRRVSRAAAGRSSPRSACSLARATTARRSSCPTARRRRPTTCSITGRAACPAAARRMCGPARAATSATRYSTASARDLPCCGSAAAAAGRCACSPPSRTRNVPMPRGRCAKSGGARSLRTRYRGGAAGPACRLARQCRSAGRRRYRRADDG